MPQFCYECNKTFKSLFGNQICRHINSKNHQKNKLKNDNKSYNTLLALVRNNVDSNLMDNINTRVINNYIKKQEEHNNNFESYDIYNKEKEIHTRNLHNYYYHRHFEFYKQIEYNDDILWRLALTDIDNTKIINLHRIFTDMCIAHLSIKDFDIRERYQNAMWNYKEKLRKITIIIRNIIDIRLYKKYNIREKEIEFCNKMINEELDELYGENHNKTIENVMEELEDMISN